MNLTAKDPGRMTAWRYKSEVLDQKPRKYIAEIDLVNAHALLFTGFRWNWLWGDSVWMFELDGDYSWNLKRYKRRPSKGRYKSAYENPVVVWSHEDGGLFAKFAFMQRFDPDFEVFCRNIGFRPERGAPILPVEPQVGRIQHLKWYQLDGHSLIVAQVAHWGGHAISRYDYTENGFSYASPREEWLYNLNASDTAIHASFMTFMGLFMEGRIDEARMALVL